ncbi:MAG: sensor domain-containing diguanylate cyclase [Candidatus Caldatribacteriota bacterium]
MNRIETQLNIIQTEFDQIISDLFYLAESVTLNNYFKNKTPISLQQLEEEFLIFLSKKGIYHQISLVNYEGEVIIKINYSTGNNSLTTSNTFLPNGMLSEIFLETIFLNRGELFITPFEVITEKNKIDLLRQPIVKFATPIFDLKEQKQGILILNYLGNTIIKRLATQDEGITGSTVILDAEGNWILEPPPQLKKEFDFEEKEGILFKEYDPFAYNEIYANRKGQFYTEKGLFSFITFYYFLEPPRNGVREIQLKPFSPRKSLQEISGYYWKIVSIIPNRLFNEINRNLAYNYIMYFIILGLISGILIWFSVDQYLKRKNALKKIEEYATYDSMTGFFNRRIGLLFLENEIQNSQRKRAPFTIGYIDVNNLKAINDNYGHKEGDYAIVSSTKCIKESVRKTDLLCRLGGDEFLLILPECGIEQAENLWQKIIKRLDSINSKKDKPYQISLSHGFTQFNPGDKKTADQLLAEADSRMYMEKTKSKQ